MMTNLFSIFDPSTSNTLSLNWTSIFILFLALPLSYWMASQRSSLIFKMLNNYIITEFKVVVSKTPEVVLLILSTFTFILMNNVVGLLPFTFTATSHTSITVAMALPLWLGLIIYGWSNNTSNLLVHLVPNGTPTVLMPLMVMIETISNLIRPLTLAVRLAANMIAGHLLISLLTGASPLTPLLAKPVLMSAQLALESLEIAVAMIQAYVFSVLITLYTNETNS
uniref:ATP synthase F0 subunit 6 n=1 Tax=Caprella acanthogaster TaxID=380745 RepID=UPI0023D8BC79|nr:ATP synthase F0 subunit 6 [Caprella acanthogaster]WCR50890.1 ATP synthase F0 subunit 6 [Caprella acanthogaster]